MSNYSNNGWIKLYRNFLSWQWAQEPEMVALFIYLVLSASYEPCSWRGVKLCRGELITSSKEISIRTGIAVKKVRGYLDKLEKSGEILKTSTNKYTRITIVEYDRFGGQQIKVCNNPAPDIILENRNEQQGRKMRSNTFIERYLSPINGVISYDIIASFIKRFIDGNSTTDYEKVKDYIRSMKYQDFLHTIYWVSIAKKVKNRDGVCAMCGTSLNLQAHHLNYENHGDEIHHLEDIVTLCKDCHEKIHIDGRGMD